MQPTARRATLRSSAATRHPPPQFPATLYLNPPKLAPSAHEVEIHHGPDSGTLHSLLGDGHDMKLGHGDHLMVLQERTEFFNKAASIDFQCSRQLSSKDLDRGALAQRRLRFWRQTCRPELRRQQPRDFLNLWGALAQPSAQFAQHGAQFLVGLLGRK